MTDAIVGYGTFEFRKAENSVEKWTATGPSVEAVKAAIDRFKASNPPSDGDSGKVEERVDVESEVGKGIWLFYKQLVSYYEVAVSTEVFSRAMVDAFFKRQIHEHAASNFRVQETYEDTVIYALNGLEFSYVNKQIDRWNSMSEGFEKLPPSVLLSLVAAFDSAFADFAKTLLKSKPDRYTGSDRQYSVSEILKLESLEQIIAKAADDEIDQLMSKSHADQVVFFEKSFDISIKSYYDRWADFIEIFERRNLAAHGSLRVNSRYIDNCKKAGYAFTGNIGDPVIVDHSYLEKSIDVLIEFGMLLALAAWQKQYPKSVLESFGAVVEISYSLLRDNHAEVAARLLEYGLKVKSKGADEENVKMMIINLAIAYRQSGSQEKCNKLLGDTDWSASPPQFKLCAAAIKEDVPAAISLLEAAKVSDGLNLWAIREWPAFQWVRKNEQFRDKCALIFGEELAPVKVAKTDATLALDRQESDALIAATPPPPPEPPSPATAPDTAP